MKKLENLRLSTAAPWSGLTLATGLAYDEDSLQVFG